MAWQGVAGGGSGTCSESGACMAGVGEERRPLQWTIRILLECILVSTYNSEQQLDDVIIYVICHSR